MSSERRARVLDAMAKVGVDALILGREANARYVSGARRLWLANARAFAPGCVLTAGGHVHLLSTSDDGIPADIPFEHLYPITWNPANLMARLAAVPELAGARTIGVDALTPLMEALLTATFSTAEFVNAQNLMLQARREKLPEEVRAIRRAIAVARAALDDAVAGVRPGDRERDVLARFERRMCELGATTPAFEARVGGVFPSQRPLEAGDRVVLDVGVLVDGYEGGLARTTVCGDGADTTPVDALFDTLLGALRPGATGAEVWSAWDATGAPRPAEPVIHGVGIGYEPPVVGPDETPLVAGMTLSLRAEADGWVRREIVLVGERGAELL